MSEKWPQMMARIAADIEARNDLSAKLKSADNVDARVMMAREVYAERQWRIHGVAVTPAMCAEYDVEHHRTLREFVEAENGEVLA